jgi:hypothetical protein
MVPNTYWRILREADQNYPYWVVLHEDSDVIIDHVVVTHPTRIMGSCSGIPEILSNQTSLRVDAAAVDLAFQNLT